MGRAYSLAFRWCRLLVLVAAGVFLIAPAHGRGAQVDGADSSLVGPLGDPARLVFRGCETYDPAEIRNELAHDLDVQVAAAPTASRADYLRIIEQRVTVGYRNGGFADPQVTV